MTDPVEARFNALIGALEPAARKALAVAIAKGLRPRNARRIAAQQNPDGSAFEPRKPQPQLRHRKKKLRAGMFAKLRTTTYLKAEGSSDAAVVRFASEVERIARVHQFGLRDRVNRRRDLEVAYPRRELLGFTKSDIEFIDRLVADHLASRL